MSDQPTPRDAVDDVPSLDPALRERVRTALRDVPPQDPERAQASLDAALEGLSHHQRPRRAWLVVAAAGIVGVLGVAVLGGRQNSGSDTDLDMVATPMTVDGSSSASPPAADEARLAESALTSETILDEFRLSIIGAAPIEQAQCPITAEERSYGLRRWDSRDVELLVDVSAGLLRLVDATTCEVLIVAPLTP
jgi:hypothetical protein